jgi:CubicO group peptidase (beta-lactamase class C family)
VLAEVRIGGRVPRGTSGVADLDTRKPVNPSGFFRIGSNTVTGHSWANQVTRRIINPLGLHHTYAPHTRPAAADRPREPHISPGQGPRRARPSRLKGGRAVSARRR